MQTKLERICVLSVVAICLGSLGVEAFYFPGTYPNELKKGAKIQVQVNSLKSFETELPYEYYTMPFCRPAEGIKRIANMANPGTILEGLRIENSPYELTVNIKETGKMACTNGHYSALTKAEVANLKQKIDDGYRVNMILDNLPVTVYDLLDQNQEFVRPGYELGYKDDNGTYFIYNHLVFNVLVSLTHGEYTAAMKSAESMTTIEAHRKLASMKSSSSQHQGARKLMGPENTTTATAAATTTAAAPTATSASPSSNELFFMIVGFEVSPCSIQREAGKPIEDLICGVESPTHTIKAQEIKEGAKITYTYDVYWQESSIKWASRWDAYLRMPGGKVHWFSIMNSFIVVLIMATVVALIFIRTIRRDLQKYEQYMVDPNTLDMKDEVGWKLVTGDVFRSPPNSRSLAVHLGSGVQIILTFAVTLFLASTGFLSPASRGALSTTMMVLYVSLAVTSGFTAVYMWGLMERTYEGWPMVCFQVSVFFPGITLGIFTLLNLIIHHTGSTGAVPLYLYFILVLVWFLISIPLTFVGGYLAIRVPIRDHPVRTNQIPRHLPPPPLAANPYVLLLAAGILPFGTIYIELYFAMTSIWLGYFYYLFGFVFLISLIMVFVSAEVSVICTYVQLCAEDYRWWWQSFYRGGSVAIYIALYALGFMVSSLSSLAGIIPAIIFLSYMTILILGVYFAVGTVGFISSYVFTFLIFKAVKSD